MPEPRYAELVAELQQESAHMPGSPTTRGLPSRVPGAARPRKIIKPALKAAA